MKGFLIMDNLTPQDKVKQFLRLHKEYGNRPQIKQSKEVLNILEQKNIVKSYKFQYKYPSWNNKVKVNININPNLVIKIKRHHALGLSDYSYLADIYKDYKNSQHNNPTIKILEQICIHESQLQQSLYDRFAQQLKWPQISLKEKQELGWFATDNNISNLFNLLNEVNYMQAAYYFNFFTSSISFKYSCEEANSEKAHSIIDELQHTLYTRNQYYFFSNIDNPYSMLLS